MKNSSRKREKGPANVAGEIYDLRHDKAKQKAAIDALDPLTREQVRVCYVNQLRYERKIQEHQQKFGRGR